ncbi:hypothetical protein ACF0H5_003305 [Mactra antiquata]
MGHKRKQGKVSPASDNKEVKRQTTMASTPPASQPTGPQTPTTNYGSPQMCMQPSYPYTPTYTNLNQMSPTT